MSAPSAPRRIGIGATLAVAVIAAWISYWHAYEVAHDHGESTSSAHLLPGTIDGLVVASSVVLWHAARRGRRGPFLAYFALALGVGATLGANVLHGLGNGVIGAVVAAWPAVALVLAYELLMWMVRHDSREARPETSVPDDGMAPWRVPAALLPASAEAYRTVPDGVPEWQRRALAEFAGELDGRDLPSIRVIKQRLKIGSERATEVQAFLRSRLRSSGQYFTHPAEE